MKKPSKNTLHVDLKIGVFRSIHPTKRTLGLTQCSMSLRSPSIRAAIIPDPALGQILRIANNQPLNICFHVAPKGGSAVCRPIGIAFVHAPASGGKAKDPLGLKTFPESGRILSGGALVVEDALCLGRYKFLVMIQRESDQAVGIIDPGIEHDNEH